MFIVNLAFSDMCMMTTQGKTLKTIKNQEKNSDINKIKWRRNLCGIFYTTLQMVQVWVAIFV